MDGFTSLLIHQEDKGVQAVLNALKEMGVLRWDHPNDCFIVEAKKISGPALEHYINKELQRL